MAYSDLNPHYDVSTLRDALRSLDPETVEQLQTGGAVLSEMEGLDVFKLTPDDITILQDLANRGDY